MSEERQQPNSPETNPNRERNIELFEALSWMAHSWGYPYSNLHDRDPRGYRVSYGDHLDLPNQILEVNYARNTRIVPIRPEMKVVAQVMSFPLVTVSFWARRENRVVPTPYDKPLTEYVIGSDNKIYNTYVAYAFNPDGEGKRLEYVSCLSDDDKTLVQNLEANGLFGIYVPQIDFTPKPEDSRCVDIEPHEYNEIYSQLRKIESGELALLRVRGNDENR